MKLIAILVAKTVLFFVRVLKVGSGTTLPGLIAEKIEPDIIKKLSGELKYGAIVVTGTNGKTTTAKMLSEILTESGFTVLCNPSGSNLTRGVASALIYTTNIFGTRSEADIAVFEVDEATMPEATTKIRPAMVVVTNLFRDQLDRYGELDKTAQLIGRSLRGFAKMTVVLNADDPLVASLAKYVEGEVKYFGIEDSQINVSSKAAMDSKDCLECGHEYNYKNRYFGHLGIWECNKCGAKRPKVDFKAEKTVLDFKGSKFSLDNGEERISLELNVPGLYNVYNALAAAGAARLSGAGTPAIVNAIKNYSAAFGRMETIEVDGKEMMVLLVKNPTGANQSLSAVFDVKKPSILFALNDNFADGTDVSWIWDIALEDFDLGGANFIASGSRAEDMALRFKYAGVNTGNIVLEKDPVKAVKLLAGKLKAGETGFIIPTYTAMMEIRGNFVNKEDQLSELGKVTKRGL